jgi:hypothetical protein
MFPTTSATGWRRALRVAGPSLLEHLRRVDELQDELLPCPD